MNRIEKITQRTIAKLGTEDASGRQYIRDSELKGFLIEVSPKGKAVYKVEKRRSGPLSPIRKKIGDVDLMHLSEARKIAQELMVELSKGVDVRFTPVDDEILPYSVGAAQERFLQEKAQVLKPSTLKDYRKTFDNVFADWKKMPLQNLTRGAVVKRHNELYDSGYKTAYVNKCFRNLSTMLNYIGVEPNPVDYLSKKKLRRSNPVRTRFLNQNELVTIFDQHDWETANLRSQNGGQPKFTRVVIFCILSGVRIEEAIKLRWGDVRDSVLIISDTKNGLEHTVPLVSELKPLVFNVEQSTNRNKNSPLFGFTSSSYRYAKDSYLQSWKGEHWVNHDLRRTFSEHCNLIGYTDTEIGVALNHSPVGVTQKHYLSGRLAKTNLQYKMFTDLQQQIAYYRSDVSHSSTTSPRKYHEGWEDEQSSFDDPFYNLSEIERKKAIKKMIETELESRGDQFPFA